MPVYTCHSQHEARAKQWRRVRDAVAGQDAVHEGATTYLPALGEQTPAEYSSYLARAPWYGATGRTLDGMVGLVFRTDPTFDAPDALKALCEDITLTGVDLNGLARETVSEVLSVGSYGLLVEFPQVAEQPSSRAQASAQNLRPYVTAYKAEHIINWRLERVNNAMQPTMVVLQEAYETQKDEFYYTAETQYRVLLLEAGGYVQRVYRAKVATSGGKDVAVWEQFGPDITPTMNGNRLPAIPFYPFGPEALTIDPQQSPILDLVDVNLSHYRNGADLEHGAHFTGLPTPFISGLTLGQGEKVKIGSTEAIVMPDPSGTAGYMEFTGQGLSALEKLMDRKEAQMAALGARMLAPEKAGVEAADTLSIRNNGENSALAGVVGLVSRGLSEMLVFMAEWAGISGQVQFDLNRDYMPVGLSATELTALVQAWQSGAISYQTLFLNLQRGDVIAADVTPEDEQARSQTQGPVLAQGAGQGE